MSYQKKNLTAAELSAIRAAAGKRGAEARIRNGNSRGGRKPSMKIDTDPTTTCTIRETDSNYITRMSQSLGISKAASIRVLVLAYRRHCARFEAWAQTNETLDKSIEEFGKFTELRAEKSE